MSLLEIQNLRARYGRVEVLHGVDLNVEEGSIVALLGANGAGKSTLLRAICRAVDTSGSCRFDGVDLSGRSTAAIAHLGIGHVPEGRGTFADFTVEENLRLGAVSRTRARSRRETDADLELVYETFPVLREFRRRQAGALSGGQAQMLAVARALLGRPRLLLVDEPSLGLAPLTARDLFDRFTGLRDEWALTVLLAEQNAKLSLTIADRAVLLSRGRVVHDGPSGDLATVDAVHADYLGASEFDLSHADARTKETR
ncbi:branched-chain amino acid transport system ATP-binding protein [Agromyces terreus]|uniref:Branched-chain amino acid transport system ATP-binding protein n=1 Tax=Agromyces terreus TaxID=424795 RepID=A0A9X2KCP5_9MICO|nr:ABC transporter ATP-binding protein [Agromyces terreus]MCP2371829.1 branched-chain amino acid transport system ATP-binding protein [Agromyces terreus]